MESQFTIYETFEAALAKKASLGGKITVKEAEMNLFVVPVLHVDVANYFYHFNPATTSDEDAKQFSSNGKFAVAGLESRQNIIKKAICHHFL